MSENGDPYAMGLASHDLPPCQRLGSMAAFATFEEFTAHFDALVDKFSTSTMTASDRAQYMTSSAEAKCPDDEPIYVMNIALRAETYEKDDEDLSARYQAFCSSKKQILSMRSIRRITFVILKRTLWPKYFTYRARDDFVEDKIYRHLEPALAFQLEITRMKNFDLEAIPIDNHRLHLYLGKAKQVARGHEVTDYRFFVRVIIRHTDLMSKEASYEYIQNEAERTLLEAMDALEVAFSHPFSSRTDCNHIFLNFVPTLTLMDPSRLEDTVRGMVMRYGSRLWKLRVLQAELKMTIRLNQNGNRIPMRLFLTNESGYYLDISMYREETDTHTGKVTLQSYGTRQGPLHGMFINTPYITKDHLQQKRFVAQNQNGTTYVYDFPEVFRQVLHDRWKMELAARSTACRHQQQPPPASDAADGDEGKKTVGSAQHQQVPMPTPPEDLLQSTELVVDSNGQLTFMTRPPGENEIGMVAWKMTIKTPEFPQGRDVILIANDITYKIGSFGPKEDLLFLKASEKARELGIPRVYIAANSGARIGLAEEIIPLFKVAWVDPLDPDKGFKYLYLTPSDFRNVASSVHAELIEDEGESRYAIRDVIGSEEGLGVENLRGSGMIAGETSRAYDDVVTISLVTCRSIGIGAYLVRLGQRTLQCENSHIILTGAGALNKVLGREVYTNNNQLGGVQIMFNNGVTHDTVANDMEGVHRILHWLSYIPNRRQGSLPITVPLDSYDRDIGFVPPKSPYDPVWMLAGRTNPDTPGEWQSGFFDKGSWCEIMRSWAKTVICGRARLGGIPVGVVAVEARSVELITPADPANLDSEVKVIQQAGQVWFPDSAYKTAQAIKDFQREQLPLIIFANWRGFSGGMKDMYDQVLKFGAYIVDALREYTQPVLVYLPPNAELRGGAWVVVDPTINPNFMEMYADPQSRGGVLEPEGTVEIKFRRRELVKLMRRLDSKYRALCEHAGSPALSATERTIADRELAAYEEHLLPTYHQVAVAFADLHDTAGRMMEKGCIRDIVPWKDSRRYFYWRLRRLLLEEEAKKLVLQASPGMQESQVKSMLSRWFIEAKGAVNAYLWEDDAVVTVWLQQELQGTGPATAAAAATAASAESVATVATATVPMSAVLPSSVVMENIRCMKRDFVLQELKRLLNENPDIAMDSIIHIAQTMSPSQKSDIVNILSKMSATSNGLA